MKKNTFIHGIYTLCTAGLIALLFSAGCSGLSADILRGGTDTETGGTQTAGKTVSVSFDCTDGVRMVLPSPALTGYTYTVTGTLSGGSAETLLTGKTYAEVTASGAVTVDPGSWTFTVTAYSKSSQVLAGSVTADLTSGAETLPVTLNAVTGGTGSVSVTLSYPSGKGVTKVTAALYDSPVAADSGSEQTITGGTDTDSVMFTAANVPSATAEFVRFFLYDGQGACLGSYTDSVYVVAGLASTATDTLSDINMFGVTVNILKDGSAWNDSGKSITLKKDSLTYTLSDAAGSNAATGSVPYGTYEVYADGTDTDGTLTAKIDGSAQADVSYYTVTLPTVTGCTIAAGSESPVLKGVNYSFTVTLSTGYTDSTVSVTANGSTLTATDTAGVYTVSGITAAQNVTVSGVTCDVYKITYLDKGGSTFSGTAGTGTPTTHIYGTETTLVNPSKPGYTFSGWYTEADCTGTAVTLLGAADYTGDTTLYAEWTGGSVSVVVNPPGDMTLTCSSTSVERGKTVTFTAALNGCDLDTIKWNLDGNTVCLGGTYSASDVSVDTSSHPSTETLTLNTSGMTEEVHTILVGGYKNDISYSVSARITVCGQGE